MIEENICRFLTWNNKALNESRQEKALWDGALIGGTLAISSGAILSVSQINAYLTGGVANLIIPSIGLIPNLGLISLAALITVIAVVVIKYVNEKININHDMIKAAHDVKAVITTLGTTMGTAATIVFGLSFIMKLLHH